MRINRLHVNQFRNIEDTVLDTGGSSFVVVRGRNGQGKTSLSEALSLALTETTWGLAKNGAGFAGKIRRGQPKATIEVDLQGAQRVIKRTVSLAVNSAGRTQKSEDVNDVEWNPKLFNDLLEKKKVALGIAVNKR
jgi:recombinational DNA repair ATPase RecF